MSALKSPTTLLHNELSNKMSQVMTVMLLNGGETATWMAVWMNDKG